MVYRFDHFNRIALYLRSVEKHKRIGDIVDLHVTILSLVTRSAVPQVTYPREWEEGLDGMSQGLLSY